MSLHKEDLVQGNFYRKTRLVTRTTCTTRLVTRSTLLITRSTCLPTLHTGLSTSSICLSTRSAHHFLIFVNRELAIVLT